MKVESRWLEHYLDLWARSMRSNSHLKKLGYPSRAGGIQAQSSHAFDTVDELISDSVEEFEIKNVTACIDSLPRPMQLALEFEFINSQCGAKVFRHPSLPEKFEDRERLVEMAKRQLIRKLESRGMLV